MSTTLDVLQKWAESFRILGSPVRLAILFMLSGSEVAAKNCLSVSQMRDVLGFPKNKNSFNIIEYHLSVLLKNDFVKRVSEQEEEGKSPIKVLYKTSSKTREFLDDLNLDEKIRDAVIHSP